MEFPDNPLHKLSLNGREALYLPGRLQRCQAGQAFECSAWNRRNAERRKISEGLKELGADKASNVCGVQECQIPKSRECTTWYRCDVVSEQGSETKEGFLPEIKTVQQ